MDQLNHTDSRTSLFTANSIPFIGGLFLFGLLFGYFSLFKSAFAPGWDSYFYILQVKSWFENGELHASRWNLIYPVLILIQWFTKDYVLTYKLFALISYALFGPCLFILARVLKAKPLWAFTIGLIGVLNPQLLYVASQFSKNLFAIDLFILFVATFPSKKWIRAGILAFALGLSHTLMLALGLVFGGVYLFHHYFDPKLWIKCVTPYVIAIGVATGFYFFLPNQIAHNFDLPIIRFLKSHNGVITTNWKIWLIVTSLIPIVNILGFKKLSPEQKNTGIALASVYLLLNIPILGWDPMGYAFRFFMVFGCISIFCLSILRIPNISKLILLAVTGPLMYLSVNTYSPKLHDPPYAKYSFISASVAEQIHESSPDLIICHKSLAEFISYETGQDVLPWGVNKDEISPSTLRLVFVPSEYRNQFKRSMSSKLEAITLDYYLVTEQDYQRIWLDSLTEEEVKDFLTWRNPYLVR